jgi:hypothetical protein
MLLTVVTASISAKPVSDRFQLSDEQEIDEMRVLHYESDGLYSEFRSYGDLAMSGDTYEVIQKSA